jgi:hypothetical protein
MGIPDCHPPWYHPPNHVLMNEKAHSQRSSTRFQNCTQLRSHERSEPIRRKSEPVTWHGLSSLSMFRRYTRKLQRVSVSHSERLSRQPLCDFDGMEDTLALSEDLVDFLELKVAGLREEEVDDCTLWSDDVLEK